MMCDIILYFTVIFADGHKEDRIRWATKETASGLVGAMLHPEELRKLDMTFHDVQNLKIKIVKPFDCDKGPDEQAPKRK